MSKSAPRTKLQTSPRQPGGNTDQATVPSDAIMMITAAGVLEMCSQETACLLGYPQARELVGKSWLEWIAPADQESIQRILQSEPLTVEKINRLSISLLHREGRHIPVEIKLTRIAASLDDHAHWIAQIVPPLSPDNQVGNQAIQRKSHDATEEALRQSEERLRVVVSNAPVILFAVDCNGKFTLAEGKALSLLGQKSGQIVGKTIHQILPHHPEIELHIRRAINGESFSMTVNMNIAILELWCSPIHDGAGEIQGMLCAGFDVTKQKKAEEALRKSEERYRLLVENQGEGACIIDENLNIEYLNLATETITGRSSSELIGHNLLEILPQDQIPILDSQVATRQEGKSSSYELVIMRPNGEQRTLLVTATPRFDATGKFIGSFAIFRDITDRKHIEDRLHYWGTHDALTGLFNRFTFEEELRRLEKDRHSPVAAIIVDIDDLKEINDTYGHRFGDEVIRRVAQALRLSFRVDDMIARIGGDEFAILLANTDQEKLTRYTKRLRHNLTNANLNWDASYPISVSIGGMIAQKGQSLQETLARADQQMYEEKQSKQDNPSPNKTANPSNLLPF